MGAATSFFGFFLLRKALVYGRVFFGWSETYTVRLASTRRRTKPGRPAESLRLQVSCFKLTARGARDPAFVTLSRQDACATASKMLAVQPARRRRYSRQDAGGTHSMDCQTMAGFASVTRILESVLPMKIGRMRKGECCQTTDGGYGMKDGRLCTMCVCGHGKGQGLGSGVQGSGENGAGETPAKTAGETPAVQGGARVRLWTREGTGFSPNTRYLSEEEK